MAALGMVQPLVCQTDSGKRSNAMTTAVADKGLQPNMIPAISQSEVSMVVATVGGVHWHREVEYGREMDAGPVRFEVVEGIHGALRAGEEIEVPAKRVVDPRARMRHNFDSWNLLSLTPGECVLLAVRRGAGKEWIGVAGRGIASPAAPEVDAVRRAYAIEEAPGGVAEKARTLGDALREGPDLLMLYALDYLKRHGTEREASVRIMAPVVVLPGSSDREMEVGRTLSGGPFFVRTAGADRVNGMVVASLATALVRETDAERQASWAQLLASCALMGFTDNEAENYRIRAELTHAAGAPPRDRVLAVLSRLEQTVQPDARPQLAKLQETWKLQ
jgi:hypothetical protein